MITVKILLDSINPAGVRITTWILKYPRFIHSEFMTHRDLSKNAASSRAIPINKMIKAVIDEPAVPEFWGANQKGMQAAGQLKGLARVAAQFVWKQSRWLAIAAVWLLDKIGMHKQITNRLLEPWSHITVVMTSTKMANFFALRAHPLAQPEFHVLAYRMLHAYICSQPKLLLWDRWHLPFIEPEDWLEIIKLAASLEMDGNVMLAKVSSARCARVSYLTHEGTRDIEKDLALCDKLLDADPMHASAFEHAAQASDNPNAASWLRSNFDPTWRQFRKDFPQNNTTELNLPKRLTTKPDWITI